MNIFLIFIYIYFFFFNPIHQYLKLVYQISIINYINIKIDNAIKMKRFRISTRIRIDLLIENLYFQKFYNQISDEPIIYKIVRRIR